MAKMRINELARELEVKAKAIIDYLAEAGVEEKKSHSSSIEGDLAEKVKAHFQQKEEEAGKAASPEPEAAPKAPEAVTPEASAPVPVEPAKAIQPREVPGEARTALPPRKPVATEAAPGRRTPLRPPIRSQGAPKPVQPPPGRTILEPKPPPSPVGRPGIAPPGSAERLAAVGKVAGKRSAPLGPAKPGEPIYSKRPIHPAGRPSRTSGAPAPGRPPMQGEPARRGMHPVRGRPPGAPTRGERERRAQQSRDRSPRVVAPPKPPPPIVIDKEITITEGITVKDLSEKLGLKARDLIRRLLDMGILATINQTMDPSLAEQVAKGFGAGTTIVSYEEEAMQQVELEETPGKLLARAPVVTVMGHVDHGKTSLLDAIRETNVTAREAGGITQHIGAYAVTTNGRKIVFVDTPGHEAFTRMRARGSKITDVVVLVVAADDGVMPQTLEAINHARAAKVPILVAINKVDKPDAMTDRVKKQLSEHSLVSEDWGGDTVTVEVSAKEKKNISLLLEMILLVADLQDLKANPERPAQGTVIEAKLDKGRGPVSSVLVQNGTLRVGDSFLVGAVFGKVRAMLDDLGMPVREAPPSTPVEVLGLQSLPRAGEHFQVASDLAKAKQTALYRAGKLREINLAKSSRLTLEHLHDQLKTGTVKELPLILKADVQGSVEVLSESLTKLGGEQVKTKVIHAGVGAINISDVLLASASNSIIVGFNVRPEKKATELAQQEKVDIRLHTVIYNVTDEMKKAMLGLMEPTHREVTLGKAEVRQTFRIAKMGVIAGSQVSEGRLTRAASVRLLRDNVVIHEGRISSLRRFKEDVAEVKNGYECGIMLENFNDVKLGDVIEAFILEEVVAEVLV